MVDALLGDVAVTWLGAAGCALYFQHLWSGREGSPAAKATLFLFGVLAFLLAVRGFYWIYRDPLLGRCVFFAAALLPVAITLFAEHMTRRHHPLWLKAFALGATATFLVLDAAIALPQRPELVVAFLAALLVVLAGNGWELLVRGATDLSAAEITRCRALVVAAVAALPLVGTDFREVLGFPPVRLGALGALLLCYVLVHFSASGSIVATLVRRLAVAASASIALAATFAVASHGLSAAAAAAALRGLPVAFAWVLLTAVFMQLRSVRTEAARQGFLRWLLHARLDDLEGFLASLRRLPLARDHVVLAGPDLADYRVEQLLEFARERRDPASLAEARSWLRASDAGRIDVAEQLVDMLERHGMTHALVVAERPPVVVLLHLPPGPDAPLAELRAGVLQRLARRVAKG